MKDKSNEMKLHIFKTKGFWLNFSMFFAFTILSVLFEIFCLNLVKDGIFAEYRTLWLIGGILLTFMAFVVGVVLYIKEKETWHKLTISLFVLLIFTLIVLFFMLKSGFFDVVHSPEKFKEYLEKAGSWMALAYIILQFLQVLILPIPSFVSVAAGVALFGAPKTLLYSFLAIVPASILGFFVGRKLGTKAVSWMIGKDSLEKWQKKLKGKDNLILTTMFLLPLFPDDILCFLAGLSSMSNKYFLIMIVVCRLVNLSGTTFSIELIPFTTWWGILLWVVLGIIFGLIFLLHYKNTDKISEWARKKFLKNKNNEEK